MPLLAFVQTKDLSVCLRDTKLEGNEERRPSALPPLARRQRVCRPPAARARASPTMRSAALAGTAATHSDAFGLVAVAAARAR